MEAEGMLGRLQSVDSFAIPGDDERGGFLEVPLAC